MILLSERGEPNKKNANKVLYEVSYEALLTRMTRLWSKKEFCVGKYFFGIADISLSYNQIVYSVKFAYFAGKTSTKLS